MKTRVLLLSSTTLALASGCDALTVDPGDDFRVEVAQSRVDLAQAVGTYNLEFTLAGCNDFVADVSVNNGERHALSVESLGGGRFRASLPVEQLRVADSYCIYDATRPQHMNGTLSATCRQDARVTTSFFQVAYAPAWRTSYRGRGPVEAVFASSSPDRFYQIGSGWLDGVDNADKAGPEVPATTSNAWPPLLTESADKTVRLWSACPINDCGSFYFVDTPTEKVMTNAAIVQVFKPEGNALRFERNITAPPDAVDFVTEGTDAILLSSVVGSTTITRIGAEAATVIANLEGESKPTKIGLLDGAHVFLTRTDSGRIRLRRVDGSLVADVPAPGTGAIELTSLAPTGDAWVMVRGGQAWISTLDRASATPSATATQLPSTLAKLVDPKTDGYGLGVTWTATGVVLRDETGIELYEHAAPFGLRWSASIGDAFVRGAVGVGDSVAVLTRSGVRIFDAAGRVIGGADPISPACALEYQPQHLAVVGPDVVALAGRGSTYQFKVGAVSVEVSR